MKRRFLRTVAALALVLAVPVGTAAADVGATRAEAVAMVKKAIAYYRAHGADKAFAEIHNPNGPFRDRDLYVGVLDLNGKYLAHGVNTKIVGKTLIDLKDVDGRPIVRSALDVANAKGSGWVDYKWANPLSGAVEPKTSYVERADDLIFVAGVYRK